jgi:hypothetical protein
MVVLSIGTRYEHVIFHWGSCKRRHDTQRYDFQHNDTRNNGIQYSILNRDTRHKTFSIMTLSTNMKWHYAECHYAECHHAECRYAECHHAECLGALQLRKFEH